MTRTVKVILRENCVCQSVANPVQRYDAAPDDATRALLEFARAIHDLEESHPEDVDPRLKAAWDKFTSTPEGAALIRQAIEESSGST